MSQVSKERILELQEIIKKDYERDVSFEEASKIANGLVGYFDTLAKIHHKEQKKRRHDHPCEKDFCILMVGGVSARRRA